MQMLRSSNLDLHLMKFTQVFKERIKNKIHMQKTAAAGNETSVVEFGFNQLSRSV